MARRRPHPPNLRNRMLTSPFPFSGNWLLPSRPDSAPVARQRDQYRTPGFTLERQRQPLKDGFRGYQIDLGADSADILTAQTRRIVQLV